MPVLQRIILVSRILYDSVDCVAATSYGAEVVSIEVCKRVTSYPAAKKPMQVI